MLVLFEHQLLLNYKKKNVAVINNSSSNSEDVVCFCPSFSISYTLSYSSLTPIVNLSDYLPCDEKLQGELYSPKDAVNHYNTNMSKALQFENCWC